MRERLSSVDAAWLRMDRPVMADPAELVQRFEAELVEMGALPAAGVEPGAAGAASTPAG